METIKNALDFSDFPRFDLMIAGLVFLFLLTFPVFPFSAFAMATMIQFLMFSLYGMGWNTIGGYGGQVDLGKAQYVGIGAYTTAVMLIRWDIPFWVSMPVGVFFAVCWSFIIGYPLFRLKDIISPSPPLPRPWCLKIFSRSGTLSGRPEDWRYLR